MSEHIHSHSSYANTKRLTIMLCLSSSFLIAEVVGGILTGSFQIEMESHLALGH